LAEIDELSKKLEMLRANRDHFLEYKSALFVREKAAEECRGMLEYNWYSVFYKYRIEIEGYLKWLKKEINDLEEELIKWNDIYKGIKEHDALTEEIKGLRRIAKAYPFWTKWKEEMGREKDMRMRMKELEGIVDGAVSGGSGGSG
jgi:hemerythrin superfamily protein